MSLYFALETVENNKNKKSVKFQGDMLNFCDFIQVFVFTRNHHLKRKIFLTGANSFQHSRMEKFVQIKTTFGKTKRKFIAVTVIRYHCTSGLQSSAYEL